MIDATAAISAAWTSLAAAGRVPVLGIPPNGGQILISGGLNPPAGAGLVGLFGHPIVRFAGATQTVVSNPGFVLQGLTLLGDHASTVYKFRLTSTQARVSDLLLTNWNSGFDIAGSGNSLSRIDIVNARGAGIRITGGRYNNISDIDGENIPAFLIYLQDAAAFNTISRVRKRVDFSTLTAWQQETYATNITKGRFGLECVGIRYDCYRNSVVDYYIEDGADAGFSMTGYENTITGGRAINCEGSALAFIESRNCASGIVSNGCKRAVGMSPSAGGLAKDNVVSGCIGIGNWYAGFVNAQCTLRVWGASASDLFPSSSYCRYGLNMYQTEDESAVNSFGTIPPTHTSGVASDGLHSWRWVNGDPVTLHADRNIFIGCIGIGGGQGRNEGLGLDAGTGTDYYIEPGSGESSQFYASPA
ncbi:MAG: hypothetical protein QM682_06360 [Paracoccus sp. (in: a-proteobacteria)]|uniref:hypothetical protein n=1 Tax=Paracoccus sp. TaxID=267 RepID=UPI0039E38920